MVGDRLAGKVAIVTGAGSGIGHASAVRFAEEGARVTCVDVDRDAVEAVVREIGPDAHAVGADVSDPAAVRAYTDDTVARWGRLDVAFNNAGTTAATGPTDRLELAAWQAEIDANLTSVFLCLKYEIAALTDGGAILNNASIAAVSGTPFLAAYTAAKHGVLGLTRSTALEVVDRGVRINALITGNVDTPLYRRLSGVGPHDALPPAPNPTGRTASTDEIASFVAYLLSDEAAFITGAALTADGGFTAS
jgi:NAD(P)-dependent dehydrogenase (short-subunit alcohol dehydrogenase family)